MQETNVEMAKTPEDLDRLMGHSLGHDVVEAMRNANISQGRILESAAIEAFIDSREGPEVEQMRHELYFLREHGQFFFAYHRENN